FFFMGAEKDHFGFEKLTRIVGIDKYYSGEDYGNKNHHDGNWGIFDHYFLEYTAQKLAEADTPFLATVFNISSHPPYTIPKEFEQNWPGQNRARKSISYADYAIRRFFEKIKQEAWYNNTVFVFVADHSVRSLIADDANAYNSFRIPLFFHEPGRGVADTLSFPVQQTDIVPSLLELLSYNESFTSFGTWISDTSKRYIYNRYGDNIQVFDDEWMLGFHPAIDKALYFYNYRKDPQLKINLLGAAEEAAVQRELEIRVKAFLQRYNGAMIKNGLMAD
ncbi:MAG TPA: sulfatase-like hydrolase/transferase, partial [Parasegetibacter sp.]